MNQFLHIKHLMMLMLLAMLSSAATATEFTTGGLRYVVNDDGATVTVYKGSNDMSGALTIPGSVANGGTTYTVTAIGDKAFSFCTGLTSVIIPGSVTSIEARAFIGCTDLTSVTIPASVKNIGLSTFWQCSALNDIYSKIRYPDEWNLTCGDNLFYCVPVETCVLHVPKGCASYYREQEQWKDFVNIVEGDILQNGLFYDVNDDGATVTLIGADNPTDLVIPETITVDGMTYTVTVIDGDAFYRCETLTSVVIPNTVRHLNDDTFGKCSSLRKVTIGSSVQAIRGRAFRNCPALMEIHSLNPKPPYCYYDNLVFEIIGDDIDDNHLFDVYDNATLYVPMGCLAAYENAGDWCLFSDIREESMADGDINDDGMIDVTDVDMSIDMVLGKKPMNLYKADLDGNGVIDVTDVSMMIDKVLGK